MLLSLKKLFLKDPDFFPDNKGFVEELIDKGYASKSNKEAQEGRTWYIPHHGVYYPSKPGKIRVVFDCSAEFKETSLNKNLMSGDIESMFHQVLVPEKDRSSCGGKIMTPAARY